MKIINLIFIIAVVFLVVSLGISVYGSVSADNYCKEKEMIYFKKIPSGYFDLEDDVICYQIENNEVKLYYFER